MTRPIGVCSDCKFDWEAPRHALIQILESTHQRFQGALATVGEEALRTRPAPQVWSSLEYAAHTRDALSWYEDRITRTLVEERPQLDSVLWSEETDAREYHSESTSEILSGIKMAAESLANRLAALTDEQWNRTGVGSKGDERDVWLLARRAVHEAEHHLFDVTASTLSPHV